MWRSIVPLLLSVSAVLAAEQTTAYNALWAVGTQLDRSFVSRVISVTGANGDPQPERWTVLVADRSTASGVREIQVANGRVAAQRRAPGAVAGSTAGATIKTSRLNLDSSGAFSVASYTADKSHVNFESASYVLRNNERGDPVWVVTLHDKGGRPLGTIHIGANKGNVTRVEGLFRGTNMAQVQEDPVPRVHSRRSGPGDEELSQDDTGDTANGETEDDEGDENVVKKEVKRVFLRTKDDASRMFSRVRRSFDNYFYRR
ncbi:MAG: hypothetical protein H0X73_03920 [Chthoniobacterales bacterium]|nr:hypothetical protein [Chthoniobacterales bacterium]